MRDEIARIKAPDFPHEPGLGLDHIDEVFRDLEKTLTEDLESGSPPDLIQAAAEDTLQALDRYLPLIGFMLRATNVRNAFELHGPLRSLAERLLGKPIHVVLASEWEFSPFTYRSIVELPDFVLIGLPASESGNGLIVPLAGHELGHAVFERKGVRGGLETPVAAALVKAIKRKWTEYSLVYLDIAKKDVAGPAGQETWQRYFDWAMDQCEETFCDFFGLLLFGESYLHAFAYLLAPSLRLRSFSYPSMLTRVRNLVKAAIAFQIPVPPGFKSEFRESQDDFTVGERFFCSLADDAVVDAVPLLIKEAKRIAHDLGVVPRNKNAIQKALRDLQRIIPASAAPDLATIANAGWMAHHDADLWADYTDVAKRRSAVLNDLVLKSVEILDIRSRLAKAGLSA